MRATVLVDSGVLLALWDPDHTHHQAALKALERHLAGGSRLVVPVTALTQVLAGAFRATPTPCALSRASSTTSSARYGQSTAQLAAPPRNSSPTTPPCHWPTPCYSPPAK